MELLSFQLDVISTLAETFCMYHYANILFDRRFQLPLQKHAEKVYLSLPVILTTALILVFNNYILSSPYTVLVTVLQGLIFVCLFWRCDLFCSATVVGSYYFILIASGNLEMTIISLIGGDELLFNTINIQSQQRVIYLILASSYWFIVNMLIGNYLKKKRIQISQFKYLAFISIVGLLSISFISEQMLKQFSITISIVEHLFVLTISLCICVFYYKLQNTFLKQQIHTINTQNNMLMSKYQQINDAYRMNECLYHDMNHHLDVICYMDETGNISSYIKSLRGQLSHTVIKSWTGIEVLDVILSEIERKADEKSVQLHVDAEILSQDTGIEKKDLCALSANLLENAVEASVTKVFFALKPVNQMLFIRVENDFAINPTLRNGRPKSTKKDHLHHGWGTQSINFVVQKYKGDIEYQILDGIFRVDIIINCPSIFSIPNK